MTEEEKRKKKKKKEQQDKWLEEEIFRIMEKSLQAAMNEALDNIFKEWK